ncbi:MAG: hypothetical protein WDW38_006982 [Sanguina aurantia]
MLIVNVQDVGVDALKKLADSLREKKGVTYATAKMEIDPTPGAGQSYVEFFRAKDFSRYFQANPHLLEGHVAPLKPGRTIEDQVTDLMQMFSKRKFVRKAERKYKTPKPGRKRLVKFPRTLEKCEDSVWSDSAFYVWLYDRPTSIWTVVATVALPVVVIGACSFSLAPWWMRMTLVYSLMGLLTLLLGLLTLRYVLFTVVWIVTGHSFWLFPNLTADEVGIWDAFSPVISYEKPSSKKNHFLPRIVTMVAAAGLVYMLYTHSPDADKLKKNARKAHDQIFDYLDVYGKGKAFLPGNVTESARGNGTSNSTANSSRSSGHSSSESSGQGTGQRKAGGGESKEVPQRGAPLHPTDPDEEL